METIDILRNIWFVLTGLLFAVYTILDGFDLGAGMLMPFVGKTDKDRKTIIKAIWPFWDGNEVWLIAGAGALFAVFPLAYAAVFSRFYMIFMIVLFALIFRAVSLEFYNYDENRKKLWAYLFTAGSFIPPLLLGVITGNLLMGVPAADGSSYVIGFSTLFRPFPVLIGILLVLAMIIHGGLYLIVKTKEELREKARKAVAGLWLFLLIIFAVGTVSVYFFIHGSATRGIFWISSVIVLIFIILLRPCVKKEKDTLSFILSSLILFGFWTGAALLLYPDLLRDLYNADSLTIFNASAGQRTLIIMLIAAAIGIPVVIGYTVYSHRVFKGKISDIE